MLSRVVAALIALSPALAQAQSTAPSSPAAEDTRFLRLTLPGEYMIRGTVQSPIPLTAPGSDPGANTLGQNAYALHWLRVSPDLNYEDRLLVRGQIDLLTGVVAGDLARYTSAALRPRDSYDGYTHVDPRWLYLEWRTRHGLLRAGQMGSHWGLGILANDGNHDSLFGDHLYGDIVERVMFASKPGGEHAPLALVVGGDLVYRDAAAQLVRGDLALQGLVAALYDREPNVGGVYAVYRSQRNADGGDLSAVVLDAFVKIAGEDARARGGVFCAFEVAAVLGQASLARSIYTDRQALRQLGGIAVVGWQSRRWTLQIEGGWASGDSNPIDGVQSRFTMSPDHNVGVVLFDEVMAWQTARAASLASDPGLVGRPAPGVQLLPTNGGVAGAAYVNPTVALALGASFRAYAGVVVAQSTSDVVDPYRLLTTGAVANYQGGDPRAHDLGIEFDAGIDYRRDIGPTKLRLGVQGGTLFPGHAFANAQGEVMPPVNLGQIRAGVLF